MFSEVKERIKEMLETAKQKIDSGKNVANAAITSDELDKLIRLSDKKIITYSELIKRDINSAKVYWN